MGRLTQVVYPSLGITFIAIQENINSTTGEGMEMLPFYSIFNEWYAAQTSKKIRAVNELKALRAGGLLLLSPTATKKIEGDKEQWYIDEPAAKLSEGYSLSALPEKARRRLQSSWNGRKSLSLPPTFIL